jgi:hypothetical protein
MNFKNLMHNYAVELIPDPWTAEHFWNHNAHVSAAYYALRPPLY